MHLISDKKNPPFEEDLNLNYEPIIAYNNQSRNELSYFFDRNVLRMADYAKLKRLLLLSEEMPFKWCRDNLEAEFKRRAVWIFTKNYNLQEFNYKKKN